MTRSVAWLALVLGCGPAVGSEGNAGETGTGGTSTGDVSTGSTTSTPTTDPSTSVGTSVGTSTDETTTESADESSSSDSSAFLLVPDWGGLECSTLSLCDVWSQDCPEGEKCVVYDGDGAPYLDGCVSFRCSPLDPNPAQPGEACSVEDGPWSGFDNCDVSSYCWDVDPDTLEGVCIANCMGSEANPICEGGLECFHGYSGDVTACVPACDPFAPDCGDGSSCTTKDGAPSVCLPDSLEIPAEQGLACDHSVGCGKGFACVSSICRALCDPAAPACAEDNPVCTPLAHDPSVGACTAA